MLVPNELYVVQACIIATLSLQQQY